VSTEVLFSRLKYFFQLANANFRIKIKQFGQSTSICEFKEEFTQSFRTEFVRSATEACVEKASGKSPFDSATTEKICRCIGEKTVDQINPEEATSLLSGSDSMSDELKKRIKDTSIACTKEVLGMADSKTK